MESEWLSLEIHLYKQDLSVKRCGGLVITRIKNLTITIKKSKLRKKVVLRLLLCPIQSFNIIEIRILAFAF
jgi:hypothetical protein